MEPVVPDIDAIQEAKRDVLQSCIYGVDLNPMAVELAKVSLWINAMVKDKPLNFLDHHIKCGNSLLGATPELITKGVPDGAFDATTGDDKKVAKNFKEINKKQRKVKGATLDKWEEKAQPGYAEDFARLSHMEEDSAKGVVDKCKEYHRIKDAEDLRKKKLEADAWTAAFFVPLNDMRAQVPTSGEVSRLGMGVSLDDPMAKAVEEIADRYRFFHWFLEFPEVFAAGGFDVVLGNPHWERIKLQETEFFAAKDHDISNAPNADARRRLIKKLAESNHILNEEYATALRDSEAESKFIRISESYPLTGVGDVNTYAVFAELAQSVIKPDGRVGIIVPSGIATDYTYRNFFSDLMEGGKLISLYDFENRERILFPAVYYRMRFCLLTMTLGGAPRADFAFFLHNIGDLKDEGHHISPSHEDLARINPNTRTCPIFSSRRDADMIWKLYGAAPVLINEETGKNPWDIRFSRMFDMANDSKLFHKEDDFPKEKWTLERNSFRGGNELYLPLYEGRMIDILDHRLASTVSKKIKLRRSAESCILSDKEKQDPYNFVMPRYWVNSKDVADAIPPNIYSRGWTMGYMSITSATNARTAIGAILPLSGYGHSIILLLSTYPANLQSCLAANFSCFVFDYICKQKISGNNFSNFIVKQLPIFPPNCYSLELLDLIVPKVVELTYTAWDLEPFARDILKEVGEDTWNRWFPDNPLIGGVPATFQWDEERRLILRAELDAIYAHLYSLTKQELDYILETFSIVKRRDEEKSGHYHTKELIFKYYDEYTDKILTQEGE